MLKFIRNTATLIFIVFSLWGIYRDIAPYRLRYGVVGHALDHTLDRMKVKIGDFYGLLRNDRFLDKIIPLKINDTIGIIEDTLKQNKPLVLYFFSDECLGCYNNLSSIENINKSYNVKNKQKVFVLPIAIANNKTALSSFLNGQLSASSYNIVMVSGKDEPNLQLQLENRGLIPKQRSLNLAPAIVIVKRNHNAQRINPGFGAEIDLREALDVMLNEK